MSVRLSQINIYPIKSCRGISVDSWDLEPRGLKYDRRWMLVDESGKFLTQREFPRMTLISVHVHADYLRAEAPGMQLLEIPFRLTSKIYVPVVVWDDSVEGIFVGRQSDEWFTGYLGISCRLVAMTERSIRAVNPAYAIANDPVSFADGFPLMLISEASLADLNSRLEIPVPMRRFRPNLVVHGCEPFAEDSWKEITVGNVNFHVVKPCERCTITTVNPDTGEKGSEPLRTLAMYRSVDNKVLFGQNLIHESNGTLNVGDELRVVR